MAALISLFFLVLGVLGLWLKIQNDKANRRTKSEYDEKVQKVRKDTKYADIDDAVRKSNGYYRGKPDDDRY